MSYSPICTNHHEPTSCEEEAASIQEIPYTRESIGQERGHVITSNCIDRTRAVGTRLIMHRVIRSFNLTEGAEA